MAQKMTGALVFDERTDRKGGGKGKRLPACPGKEKGGPG